MDKTNLKIVYRDRRYSVNGRWCHWYEPCSVVKETPKRVTVVSQDYLDAPLYPGGNFTLSRQQLITDGRVYHSRHGDWFYLDKPRQGDPFPGADIVDS